MLPLVERPLVERATRHLDPHTNEQAMKITFMCPKCFSTDGEEWDDHVCSWCGGFMVESYRLPQEDQDKAWTQLSLIKS